MGEKQKVFVVIYLYSGENDINTTAWVNSTEEKAQDRLQQEREELINEYKEQGWEIQKDQPNMFVIHDGFYSNFVELKIIERYIH